MRLIIAHMVRAALTFWLEDCACTHQAYLTKLSDALLLQVCNSIVYMRVQQVLTADQATASHARVLDVYATVPALVRAMFLLTW
jgi:hypothetical protein